MGVLVGRPAQSAEGASAAVVGRDQSQLRPKRSQATFDGSHSVLMRDSSRFTPVELHFGHGGSGFVDCDRYSSNALSQAVQRYS